MSQDENIIKDLNNNEQSSLTPFLIGMELLTDKRKGDIL